MDANRKGDPGTSRTKVERESERALVVTRIFHAPARIVFEAWTRPDLFKLWWAPKSFGVTFVSAQMDVRTGGTYRLMLGHPSREQPMAFFGRYLEVTPPSRLVWTNDEGDEEGAITTVTFEESEGVTRVVLRDLYPSKEALDEAIASQATSGFGESFEQLDGVLGDVAPELQASFRRLDAMPDLDARSAADIIGYDEEGLPR